MRCKSYGTPTGNRCPNNRISEDYYWCQFHNSHGSEAILVALVPPESKYSTRALAEAILSLQLPQLEKEQLATELSEAICERDNAFSPSEFIKIIRGVKA